jgi:hypothetical protein
MATKRKGRTYQLTRDTRDAGKSHYCRWGLAARLRLGDDGYWYDRRSGWPRATMLPRDYHREAAPSARLEPGGGPIRVRVTIEAE